MSNHIYHWDGSPLSPAQATEFIYNFLEHYGQTSLLLAAHVAIAEQYRADIVSIIRFNFLEKENFNTSLDSNILFGPLSYNLGSGLYKMDKEVRKHLITALGVWSDQQGFKPEDNRPSKVAELLRHYVREKIKKTIPDSLEENFLNQLGWVALGYHNPKLAVQTLARDIASLSHSSNPKDDITRINKLRPLLELPLAPHIDLLNIAKSLEAASEDDFIRAQALASQIPDEQISIADIDLSSPHQFIRQRQKSFSSQFSQQSDPLSVAPGDDNVSLQSEKKRLEKSKLTDKQQAGEPEELENTALHLAVIEANIEQVKQCLDKKPEIIDNRNHDYKSALHLAAATGLNDIVSLLIKAGAEVNIEDSQGSTPIFSAIENQHIQTVNDIISDADLTHCNHQGETCLHEAIRAGSIELMEMIITESDIVNLFGIDEDEDGEALAPLLLAAKLGDHHAVKLLLKYKADINITTSDGAGALAMASSSGNTELCQLLIELGFRLDAKNNNGLTPIMYAAYHGHLKTVEQFIQQGINYDYKSSENQTALHHAVQSGNLELIEYLINFYPSTHQALTEDYKHNGYSWSLIRLAAYCGHYEVVKYLIDLGESVHSEFGGWNLLHLCCQGKANTSSSAAPSDYPNLIKYLLEKGLDINWGLDNGKHSPLHIAASHNAVEIVKVLTSHQGIKLNTKNSEQLTPFLFAATKNSSETIEVLLDVKGIDLKATSKEEKQVLALAVEANASETVSALLKSSAIDRNHKPDNEKERFTPIWIAADKAYWEVFSILCADEQVDLDTPDKNKNTLLHKIAGQGSKLAIYNYLKSAPKTVDLLNKNQETALLIAIKENNLLAAQTLLSSGATPHRLDQQRQTSPLKAAIKNNSIAMINALRHSGADIKERDKQGKSLLHYAASLKHGHELIPLLIHHMSVDHLDEMHRTALHDAIEANQQEAVNLLSNHNANWNQADHHGLTPLHFAIRAGNHKLFLLGIKHNADIKQLTKSGWSSLHLAALYGFYHMALYIIKQAPELVLHISTEPQATPLQVAAEVGFTNIVRELIARGADIDIVTDDKPPAIFLAVANGRWKTAQELLDNNASTTSLFQSELITLEAFRAQRLKDEAQFDIESKADSFELRSTIPAINDSAADDLKQTLPQKNLEEKPTTVSPRELPLSDWTLNPMQDLLFEHPDDPVSWPWNVTKTEDKESFFDQINPIDGKYEVHPQSTQVLWSTLPFYENVQLIRVRNKTWRNKKLCIYYLTHEGNLFRLNGTSPPIHEVNSKAPVQLNNSNIIQYLRFFGFFVRGEEGPFYILEDSEDPALNLPDDISHTALEVLRGTVQAASFEGVNNEGHYLVDAVISYSNAIFLANFAIHNTGMVEMLDDEPIAADLPFRIKAPVT